MSGTEPLVGNGAQLVRERAVASRIQDSLERMYRLDRVAHVNDFVREASFGERESLRVREAPDGDLEIGLYLPSGATSLDATCQIIEGVSHFVYLVDRAHASRAATQLELELQAEVDKWLVLAASLRSFDVDRSQQLRARLYEKVLYTDDERTENGERYRLANGTANRFVRRLEKEYVESGRFAEMHGQLRRFFCLGQEDKLRMGV